MNPDLVQLVKAATEGDSEAFSELARIHRRVAASIAYGILNDMHLAADAVQDAFLKAYERLHQLNDPEAFVSWFLNVVRASAIDILRRQKRWGVREISVGSASDSGEDESEPEGVAIAGTVSRTPPQHMEDSENAAAIREALAALSPEYREVILLKHSEGRSYREIARLLRTSVRSVESRLFRARQQLGRILGRRGIETAGLAGREDGTGKQQAGADKDDGDSSEQDKGLAGERGIGEGVPSSSAAKDRSAKTRKETQGEPDDDL